MKLTRHFNREEFELGGAMPAGAVGAYACLCGEILEPIRERFGVPIFITSGYRSPEHNEAVGGVPQSEHVATAESCAADFRLGIDLQVVFDWVRLSSGLPFHEVILEREDWKQEPICIHISWRAHEPRRVALEGLTHGRSHYRTLEVSDIASAIPPQDVPISHFGES